MLSETGNAVVTLTNTDNNDGSDGDVIISGPVYVSAISAGISATGTAGAGQILSEANATIDGDGGTVILSAGSGIGIPGTSIDITDVATLDATTTTGGIYIQNTSATPDDPDRLRVERGHRCDVVGGDRFEQREQRHGGQRLHDGYSNPRREGGAIVDENRSTVYASTLVLTATDGIGTSSSPLETSSPGTLTLTASAGDGLFLDNNTALTVNSATAGNGDLSISATGNLTLQGNVSSTGNVTLTATGGTLTTNGTVSISADSLTITAEPIGSTNDFIQTSATTINATANYGGIYLSNNNSADLTLSAAAVGPILSMDRRTISQFTARAISSFSRRRPI